MPPSHHRVLLQPAQLKQPQLPKPDTLQQVIQVLATPLWVALQPQQHSVNDVRLGGHLHTRPVRAVVRMTPFMLASPWQDPGLPSWHCILNPTPQMFAPSCKSWTPTPQCRQVAVASCACRPSANVPGRWGEGIVIPDTSFVYSGQQQMYIKPGHVLDKCAVLCLASKTTGAIRWSMAHTSRQELCMERTSDLPLCQSVHVPEA